MNLEEMKNTVVEHVGSESKMICGSKGRYRYHNPSNMLAFNANICTKEDGKIWHGDVDITLEEDNLIAASAALGKVLYVLPESAARFEKKEKPDFEDAYVSVDAICATLEGNSAEYYHRGEGGKLVIAPRDEEPYVPSEEVLHKAKFEDYKQEDYPTKIKLPDMKTLESRKKAEHPFDKFYLWVAGELGGIPEGKQFDTTTVCVLHNDYLSLFESLKSWMQKKHHMEGYDLEKGLGWAHLDAPYHFSSHVDPNWAEEGYVYVKKDYFVDKE